MHPNPMPSSTDTNAEDIEAKLRPLLHQPLEPETGEWLFALIQESGHLSTSDHLRWRVLGTIWLAFEFDTEKVWPYLMWLNMNEPTIGEHLDEILTEAVDDFECHVKLANWLANASDERLGIFFSTYKNIPHHSKMSGVFSQLLTHPSAAETGVWLNSFCRDTIDNSSPSMRGWRLLSAAWLATNFDAKGGLIYLQKLSDNSETLSEEDCQLLTDTADTLDATAPLIQWIADCDDTAIKTMLNDVGHPNLAELADTLIESEPDYQALTPANDSAEKDVAIFTQFQQLLAETGTTAKDVNMLNLACGPLGTQTLLFASAGFKVTGADLNIPPAYLPTTGLKQGLKKRKHVSAWKESTDSYYRNLSQHSGLKLKWKKVNIELADLTRLPWPNEDFNVIVCVNHLQHAPDVAGVLAEAARVLKPNGVLVASIVPYSPLTQTPRANQWTEAQYKLALEKYFNIEQWLTEKEALTPKNITLVARKNM